MAAESISYAPRLKTDESFMPSREKSRCGIAGSFSSRRGNQSGLNGSTADDERSHMARGPMIQESVMLRRLQQGPTRQVMRVMRVMRDA